MTFAALYIYVFDSYYFYNVQYCYDIRTMVPEMKKMLKIIVRGTSLVNT